MKQLNQRNGYIFALVNDFTNLSVNGVSLAVWPLGIPFESSPNLDLEGAEL